MHVVSWNVENLAPWLDDAGGLTRQIAALGSPDVLCLQEVKIRAHDTPLADRARGLVPGYTAELALCGDTRNVTFRGGRAYGVATFVRNGITAVHAAPSWDREGRVLVTALPDLKLAVVNLYAVNGTPKPYVDPDTGAPAGDRHAHKRRFQMQLFDLADELRTKASVILAGDWNVSRSAADVTPRLRTSAPHALARAQLNDRLARDGWIDAFREMHPDARAYTWFGRTRTGALDAARVDYIVISPDLRPRVEEAAILDDRALRPRSDHAPLRLRLRQ